MNARLNTSTAIGNLCAEYQQWMQSQGLALGSADEHLNDPHLSQDQKNWLRHFCDRWDDALQDERYASKTESRYSETLFDIYVPAGENDFGIDPASAIVAGVSQRGNETLLVYFEGNQFGAENMKRFDERCLHAAGRAATRYPTIAKAGVPARELLHVGVYDLLLKEIVEVIAPLALQTWVGNETMKA